MEGQVGLLLCLIPLRLTQVPLHAANFADDSTLRSTVLILIRI